MSIFSVQLGRIWSEEFSVIRGRAHFSDNVFYVFVSLLIRFKLAKSLIHVRLYIFNHFGHVRIFNQRQSLFNLAEIFSFKSFPNFAF